MTVPSPALAARIDAAANVLLTVAVLVLFATGWATALARLMCDYPVGAVEPAVVLGVKRVAAGETLYRDYATEFPLAPMTYGVPLYVVPGLAARATGITELPDFMRMARLPSALSSVLLSLLLYLLARRIGANRLTGLWGVGVLPAVPLVFEWSTKAAPDIPALALSLLGWLLADVAIRSASRRRRLVLCVGAALVWALAFHYKMIVLVGPLAFSCQVLLSKRDAWRLWLVTGVGALALALSGVVAMQVITDGMYAANLFGSMAVCEYSPGFAAAIVFRAVESVPTTVGVVLLTGLLLRSRHWLGLAVTGVFVVNFLLAGKQGSNSNYFAETLVLFGIAVSAMPSWLEYTRTTAWLSVGARFLIAVGLVAMVPNAMLFAREVPIPPPEEYDMASEWMVSTSTAPGDVLCLDPYFGMSRRVPFLYADSYHAGLLLSAGVGDVAADVDALKHGKFRCVVANRMVAYRNSYQNAPFAYGPLKQALLERYRPVFIGSWLIVFVPEVREPQ